MIASFEVLSDSEVHASGREPELAPAEAEAVGEILLDPQEVAALAYGYWLERGSPSDSPQNEKDADWFRAESCLRARIAAAAEAPAAKVESQEDTRMFAVSA